MSKWDNGWLNEFEPLNIEAIVRTKDVSQLVKGELKAAAFKNISSIDVTRDESQADMSGLHAALLLKR